MAGGGREKSEKVPKMVLTLAASETGAKVVVRWTKKSERTRTATAVPVTNWQMGQFLSSFSGPAGCRCSTCTAADRKTRSTQIEIRHLAVREQSAKLVVLSFNALPRYCEQDYSC